jgi:hypothetical protein
MHVNSTKWYALVMIDNYSKLLLVVLNLDAEHVES